MLAIKANLLSSSYICRLLAPHKILYFLFLYVIYYHILILWSIVLNEFLFVLYLIAIAFLCKLCYYILYTTSGGKLLCRNFLVSILILQTWVKRNLIRSWKKLGIYTFISLLNLSWGKWPIADTTLLRLNLLPAELSGDSIFFDYLC